MRPTRRLLAVDALELAPRLLGAVLRSQVGGQTVALRLTEVEAYEGADDPASHAFRGRTRRNAVMFGPAGHLYCYFTYGMHWCANIVCGPDEAACAVLLRAGEVIGGVETARARRPSARRDRDLARGPARLASCLGLGAAHDGVDLLSTGAPVRLASIPEGSVALVQAGPRVGITAAADRPWRFWLTGEATVSSYKAGARRPAPAARQTGTS